MWAKITRIVVGRIVENGTNRGIMAENSCLKTTYPRGTIGMGIGPGMLECHYQFVGIMNITTCGVEIRNGQNEGIAEMGSKRKKKGWLATNTED